MSEQLNPHAAWPFPTPPRADKAMEDASPAAATEMPRYKCHKEVWALKIASAEMIVRKDDGAVTGYTLHFEEPGYAPIEVSSKWANRTDSALVGGYYVVYDDGYKSFSPAEPFESGYTRI